LSRLRVDDDTNNYQNGCGPSDFESGSERVLPAPRPLRTALACFQAYGSSHSNAR